MPRRAGRSRHVVSVTVSRVARFSRGIGAAILGAGVVYGAGAPQAADLTAPLQSVAPPPPGWRFQLTGYGWATALNGESAVRNLPPVHIDMSFGDVLEKLDGALMGSLMATNGNWMILTDLVWAKLSNDATVKLPGTRHPTLAAISPGTRVDFALRQLMASAIAGYRLPIQNPNLDIYATAGIRYQRLTAEIDVIPGLIPLTIDRQSVEGWADPIVGLAATWRINDKWFAHVLADVGGFGVGSQFTAQGFASLGYRWTESLSTAIGYRAVYTDYENNGFTYRATQHGVFTSIAYHF